MVPAVRGTLERVDALTPSQTAGYVAGYACALRRKAASSTRAAAGNESLASLDGWYQSLPTLSAQTSGNGIADKGALTQVMRWKLAREKHRPTLLALIASNSAPTCAAVLHRAASHLLSHTLLSLDSNSQQLLDAVLGTMKILAELRGVGPATSSAIVAAWCDCGIFQSDELVCNVLGPRVKVEYSWSFYRRFYVAAIECLKEMRDKGVKSGRAMERIAWSMFYSNPDDPDDAGAQEEKTVTATPQAKTSTATAEEKHANAASGPAPKRKTLERNVEVAHTPDAKHAPSSRTSKRIRRV
ncbi:uncharacterized protein SRS1_15116 [Sporisorium reilianum f. sp. reilianum]|uniref:Uncharacterized protein n=1 Tax=Sporisorium reilianum f. sp. reilianum TaxID=72559 RepID=A0A2N8UHQ2_9BASI|nr:uncharacterized protein SRS1_15116 [Sporisorium reilianum f. sp. reilianum]